VETKEKIITSPTRPNNRMIDGFARSTASTATSKKPAHSFHQRTEKAQTLMRGALKKPDLQVGHRIQKLTPGYNPKREAHAQAVNKHSQVKHFGHPIAQKDSSFSAPAVHKAKVTPRQSLSAPSASTSVALPSMVTSASHQRLERMLDEALVKADAHKQALRYQAARHFWQRPGFLGRRTGLKLTLIFLIVLAALAFVTWQKFPQLSVKVAGSRAHINATVPSYKPVGYNMAAPATVQDGEVLIKFAAAESGLGYDISQQPSNMTSTSLAQTLVHPGAQMQTSQVGGNTVYIYGEHNDAAWVNNGILYSLMDHANLSSDQIINIVKGLN
jgi:hypothetical protein